MATLSTIRLNKSPGTSWGFRLQGGKDFATPLCIQKVNVGSVAAQAGLQAGDAIVSIAGIDAFTLRHKEAQDAIVRAGNNFDVVIQRGSQIWKPNITALPEVKTLPDGVPVATKTSLAATKKPYKPIGTRHNVSAAPFREGLALPSYNTPINIYSDDSIAETLSAQAEVLGNSGVMGVNFMKNDKNFDGQTSDVLRMVHEMDQEPQVENPGTPTDLLGPPDRPVAHSHSFKILQQALQNEDAAPPAQSYPSGVSAVSAPVTNYAGPGEQLRPGENTCFICERLVVGVFVRVKGKNLHAECFKCSTCGCSLKNIGYYNINDKLYCDTHAKQAARVNPPAPNMEPVVVPPGGHAPFGAVTAQQAGRMKGPAAFQPKAPAMSHAPVPAPFKAAPPGGVRILPAPTTNVPTPFKYFRS